MHKWQGVTAQTQVWHGGSQASSHGKQHHSPSFPGPCLPNRFPLITCSLCRIEFKHVGMAGPQINRFQGCQRPVYAIPILDTQAEFRTSRSWSWTSPPYRIHHSGDVRPGAIISPFNREPQKDRQHGGQAKKLAGNSVLSKEDFSLLRRGGSSGQTRRKKRGSIGTAKAMIREVVAVGTAAASVTTSGGHGLVLRTALTTMTQVAVTAAAVCYGAYLSPYADCILRRRPVQQEPPSKSQVACL